MSKGMKVLGLIFILLVAVSALAADTAKMPGVGKKYDVTFYSPVKVANILLPAGDYVVEHVMEGENHIMVFKTMNKKEAKARVNCKMVDLAKKAEQTFQEYTTVNGDRVLTSMTFRGDKFKHDLQF